MTEPRRKLRVLLTIDRARYAMETMKSDFEQKTGMELEIDAKAYPKMYWAIRDEWYKDNYDVFDVDIPWLAEFAQKKVVENLDRYIARDPDYYDDMLPNIFEKYSLRQGSVYAIPFTFCTQLLFYRKDCFADIRMQRMFTNSIKELRPPHTWEEFNLVAQFFTRKYNPDSRRNSGRRWKPHVVGRCMRILASAMVVRRQRCTTAPVLRSTVKRLSARWKITGKASAMPRTDRATTGGESRRWNSAAARRR